MAAAGEAPAAATRAITVSDVTLGRGGDADGVGLATLMLPAPAGGALAGGSASGAERARGGGKPLVVEL